jgi:hypothetical protein
LPRRRFHHRVLPTPAQRDPAKVNDLIQLSASSSRWFYVSLAALGLGGVVAGFVGHWWSQAWMGLSVVSW